MSKITTYLSVVDSLPGRALKVNKTRTVKVSLDAQGEVQFKLNARLPKRWRNPSPETILKARKAAGLTQKAAAEKCLSALRSWQDWEYGKRRMHPAIWQVFQNATASEQAAVGTKRSKSPVRQGRADRAHQSTRA
ncbi:MAG: hypothetical protein ACYCXT_14055 [Acidiferrobacteraceae bacterium]